MDIESFSQCLNYMQVAAPPPEYMGKIIPVAGTLLGTLFGYVLNQATVKRKEEKGVQNKLMCCDEDVNRLQNAIGGIIREFAELMYGLHHNDAPLGHNLPARLNAYFLDEYFVEVAYRLSVDQRYFMHLLIEYIDEMNIFLERLVGDKRKGWYDFSKDLLAAADLAARMHDLCEGIQQNKSQIESVLSDKMTDLGVMPESLDSYQRLMENIWLKDSKLELGKRPR